MACVAFAGFNVFFFCFVLFCCGWYVGGVVLAALEAGGGRLGGRLVPRGHLLLQRAGLDGLQRASDWQHQAFAGPAPTALLVAVASL